MLKQYKFRFYNFRLVILLLCISTIGVLLVGSAAQELRSRQIMGVVLGVVVMAIVSLMDFSWILNFYWLLYIFNIVMLLGVRLMGSTAGGATRWIEIAGFRFQPTELSKILLILFFARFFMDHENDLNTIKVIVKCVVLLVIPLVLIYQQPDLKNTITVTIMFCVLIYIAGLSYKVIGGAILITVPLMIIFLSIVLQPDPKRIKDYQRDRIMSWL